MTIEDTNSFPVADRFSYSWLVLGGILGLFAFGKWTIPLAPWLVTVLFIRFMHTQKPWRGYLILSLIRMGLATYYFDQLVPESMFSGYTRYTVIVVGSLSGILPFLADRLLAPRLIGSISPLVFPVTATGWEFLTLSINPMGTFSAVAYSQYGNLPLMQLVSITGLSGLTFMITWFASTVNWTWERSFSWPVVRINVALYVMVIGVVLLYGGARLVSDKSAATIQIASFSKTDDREVTAAPPNENDAFRQKSRRMIDQYLDETRRQADAGSQLILWPEAAAICASDEQESVIQRGMDVANEKSIYLAMPLFTKDLRGDRPRENKLIVVNPEGEIVLEHYKYGGNQFEGSVLGDGALETFQTPSATVGGVICWDMDFPSVVAQSGRNGTDILLAPANDWESVSTTHAHMAVFRAIENGVSLVRHAKNGLSIATDPYGRTLAKMDHFSSTKRLMIAQIPVSGVTTVYSVIGDLFAWVTVISFPLFVCLAFVVSRRSN